MSEPRPPRAMSRRAALGALAAAAVRPAVAQQPSPQEILRACDQVRNPGVPFRADAELVEFRSGQRHDAARLRTYARIAPDTGQYRNLARYLEPARDAGKALLMMDKIMWFYDPNSRATVRVSPQQRLVGQASNSDVLTTNLNRDYKASLGTQESIKDADRAERSCWHLQLDAAGDAAMYLKIDLWVEQGSFHPVKARYFADSGRALKVAYFRDFARQLGGMRPTQVIILDEVDPNVVTTIAFSNYRAMDVPESMFRREMLSVLPAEGAS